MISVSSSVLQDFSGLFHLSPHVLPKGSGLCYSSALKAFIFPQLSSPDAQSEFQASDTDLGHFFLYLLPFYVLPHSLFPTSLFSIFCLQWVFWFPIRLHISYNYICLRSEVAAKRRKQKIINILSTLFGTGAPFSSFSGQRGKFSFRVLKGFRMPLPRVPPQLEDCLMTRARPLSHQKNKTKIQQKKMVIFCSLLYAGALPLQFSGHTQRKKGILLELFLPGPTVGNKNRGFPIDQARR